MTERGCQALEERELDRGQAGIDESLQEHARAQAEADEALVQVLPGPGEKPGVDGLLVCGEHLRDAPRRGDDHDHHHLRLQRQDLDVPDRCGRQRRRGDDGEQVGHLREGLGRGTHRLVDLALGERELELARGRQPVA